MTVTPHLQRWVSACLGAADALAFPWSCRLCGVESERDPFCASCRAELLGAASPACGRCALPLGPWARPRDGCRECRGRSLGFDGAIALGPYTGPVRELCLALKHEPNAWLAAWLADLLIEARGAALEAVGEACVVPIPLHWRRHWSRRYNQAEALGQRLARRLGHPCLPALRRVAPTRPLAGLGRTERLALMHGAFRARRPRRLRDRTVILVDDVMTTGATCGAAARALKQAGAGRVVAVLIGRAEGRQ